ncbi:MAG TPA: type II secretion system major pseudopilin GspG [Verrucomicrobiae bacterium]|nr:type II secretion system major pseudopilin GspG [Verrucomicrobiae bacterium]
MAARRRLYPQARTPALRERAFTLMELLIVVVILGILAATIIPQFFGSTSDARVARAKADIASLETVLDTFNLHMDRYPTTEEGLKVLVDPPSSDSKKWRGPYIKILHTDPWGNPYQYRYPSAHRKSGFDVWSRGADNADGGEGEGADIGNW